MCMNRVFFGLLLFVPLTLALYATGASAVLLFFLAGVAIVPLAKYIGEATEELTLYTSTAMGGFLNATFGNATEIIIGIAALNAGLIEVIKASITGSILGDLLFVLGASIFFGGLKRERQHFNSTAAKASYSSMLLAVTALVVPAIFLITAPSVGDLTLDRVSIIASVLLIVAYLASLLFSLRTHRHLYLAETARFEPRWSKTKSILVLACATVALAGMSEILVGSIEPIVQSLGWTQLFIGVIFIAIIGNAAEHVSAVTVALRDKMDLSIQITTGSAAQIAMFVMPALVLISFLFPTHMHLVFNSFELVCMVFAVFVVGSIIEDGESTWLEGLQLLVAYAIIAIAFFFHP
ncbi:MAG: calcium/proton exchanger [Patescibacteria group bacterium]|nr:calcium/proton exchanger [Patescibacteria group bacterium]